MNDNNIYENQPIPENIPNTQPVQPTYAEPVQPVYSAPADVDPPVQPAEPEQPVYAQPAQQYNYQAQPAQQYNYQQPAQQPAYVPAVPVKKEGKGLAIASLICGIASFVLCCGWFTSIPGLILGIVSKKKGYKGGMATAGVVLNAIWTAIIALAIIAIICLYATGLWSGVMGSMTDGYYDSYEDSYGYYDYYDSYDNYAYDIDGYSYY